MDRFLAHLRKSRASLLFLLIALFTLLSCALRTLAFFLGFDADIGYFRTGSVLAIIADASLLICIGLCVAISFLINKAAVPAESKTLSTPRFLTAAITCVLLCTTSFFLIFRLDSIPAPDLLVLLAAICLLGSAVYFLSRCLDVKLRTAAALGFFTLFAPALSLAVTYLDPYTQMNAPHKLSMHLCMLAIMFAMLYELRALLERNQPRAYTCATTLAASLCTVYALSNIIAFLGGVYDDVTYLLFDLLTLTFAAYFIIRAIRIALPHTAETQAETQAETEVEA